MATKLEDIRQFEGVEAKKEAARAAAKEAAKVARSRGIVKDVSIAIGELLTSGTVGTIEAITSALYVNLAKKRLESISVSAEECGANKKLKEDFKILSPGSPYSAMSIAGVQDVFNPPPLERADPEPNPVFRPRALVGGIPYGDKVRCYIETTERRPREGYGRDKCAELLSKPPTGKQDISEFTSNFVNNYNAKTPTPQF
jgi:hypothetical protein